MVHPFLLGCSPFGGYELGAATCVYEKARVEEEVFSAGLGTGFGAVVEDDARQNMSSLAGTKYTHGIDREPS